MIEHAVLIRPMVRDDVKLVTNSWMTNARKMWHTKGIPNDIFYSWHHVVMEHLLKRGSTVVACDPEDPTTIYGWACFEVIDNQFVLHYCYVKGPFKAKQTGDQARPFRGFGVGTQLLLNALKYEFDEDGKSSLQGITYTHETAAGREWLKNLNNKGLLPHEPVYNPYLMYSSLPTNWGAL